MTPGEIGTEAGRIFEYKLPSNWMFRSQEDQNDHGIDGEIEVKNSDGIAQGKEFVFKVQIKGEENSNFINKNQLLSFNLKTKRLEYYLSFQIPVILFVIEISSENVYWMSITNNEELIKKVKTVKTESIQIHLPTNNIIKRRDTPSTEALLKEVIRCWDYLAIKGVKSSIERFGELDPDLLESRISAMGNALYKAHHKQLENLLFRKDFTNVYKISADLIQSKIVPTPDRFVAGLFYRTTLRIAPRRKSISDQMEDMFSISLILIQLARDEKSKNLRHYATGLARAAKFKYEINSLYANHNACKTFAGTPEGYIFRVEMHKEYVKACLNLKKIIDLLHRTAGEGQYHIFNEIYFESFTSLLTFRNIQAERGNDESINFFQTWLIATFQFCLAYSFLSNNPDRAQILYSLALHANLLMPHEKKDLKIRLADISSTALITLDTIELNHRPREEVDFLSLTTKEQMDYFRDTARHMGMDPEDEANMLGRVVAMALKNYDPTDILSNCEHLFVHYKPGGMVAQTLQMHSAGGMHLLVCLKHKHVHGTGNLLSKLYSSSPNTPMQGFRQEHCNNCSNCSPRPLEWTWSLAWHQKELKNHIDFLSHFKAW